MNLYKYVIFLQTTSEEDYMDIKIREHICNNFKDSDQTEIRDSIVTSIESKDEVVLPGLGVLFEIVWNHSDEDFQKKILETIQNHI